MTNPSPSNLRKRPRPDPPPASPKDQDDALFAFSSALSADMAVGKTLLQAVQSLFDTIADDIPSANRSRLRALNLAEPIISALQSSPELADDVETVAKMCQSVYEFAEDEIDMLRVPRRRLELTISRLSDVANMINNADNIVVLTGAGVSVSCGIPDFRSKGGLYDTVLERFGLHDPQAIFDLDEFKMDPTLFYSFAKEVMPSKQISPSATHRFVAELERRGKLLRNYSQNIDGLESRAGVSEERLVLCHGSFLTATCMRRTCRASVSGDDIAAEVAAGTVPICKACGDQNGGSGDVDEDEDDDGNTSDAESRGVVKPDIVFFGENLPRKVGDSLAKDITTADLLVVLGTSLQVAPVARIPQYFKENVPRILVNRELLQYDFDVELLGNCDAVVDELRRALDWEIQGQESGCKEGKSRLDNKVGTKEGRHGGGSVTEVVFRPPRRFLFPGAACFENKEEETRKEEGMGIERLAGSENGDKCELEMGANELGSERDSKD